MLGIVLIIGALLADVHRGHPLLLGHPVAEGQDLRFVIAWVLSGFRPSGLHTDVILEVTRADGPLDAKDTADQTALGRHVKCIALAPETPFTAEIREAGLLAEVAHNPVGRGPRIHPAVRMLGP